MPHHSSIFRTALSYCPGMVGLVAGVLLIALTACSNAPASEPASEPATALPATPAPAMGGPEVSAFVMNQDLAVGKGQRIAFGLMDRDGFPVRSDEVELRAIYLPAGRDVGELRDTAVAKFQRWPIGDQGVFITRLNLDTAGVWGLEVTTTAPDGATVVARGAFQVKEKSATPGIGDPAPRSVTLTADDTSDLSTITSAPNPDPDLYQISIDEALDAGKPLVVVFSTPAFCLSATCGPQLEVISELKGRHGDAVNFIHVEVFENPHMIKDGRPTGGHVPAINEWGLPTEPWTFVIDKAGMVHAKFEQFTTVEDIEAALREIL